MSGPRRGMFWVKEGMFWVKEGMFWVKEGMFWVKEGMLWVKEGMFWVKEGMLWGKEGMLGPRRGIVGLSMGMHQPRRGIVGLSRGMHQPRRGIVGLSRGMQPPRCRWRGPRPPPIQPARCLLETRPAAVGQPPTAHSQFSPSLAITSRSKYPVFAPFFVKKNDPFLPVGTSRLPLRPPELPVSTSPQHGIFLHFIFAASVSLKENMPMRKLKS
jgi:hypothetical protein